jgi:hypothetical protein
MNMNGAHSEITEDAGVVLLGDTAVGKTALRYCLVGDSFYPTTEPTTAESVARLTPEREVFLLDFPGTRSHGEIISALLEAKPRVAVVVFDPLRGDEDRQIAAWSQLLGTYTDAAGSSGTRLLQARFLVASQLDRGLPPLDHRRFLHEYGFDAVFHTSAKIGQGIQELRVRLLEALRAPEGDQTEESNVAFIVRTLAEALCELVAREPRHLDAIEWRDLERMVAAALQAIGFTVELTPPAKDGGKDVVASCILRGTQLVFYIEIKHWRRGGQPGPRHILDFVEVTARNCVAGGLFLSSSGYTNDTYQRLAEICHQRVRLGTQDKIVSLCQHYVKKRDGVWQPRTLLPELLFERTLGEVPWGKWGS